MKNKLLSQLCGSCKKWKTLVLLGVMLLVGIVQMYADTPNVRGFMNSWGCTAMTQVGSTSTYYYTATSNGEFKVQNGCNWDNDKNLSHIDNSLGNITLAQNGDGNNISCSQAGTWYIVYNGSKVYATTVNPDAPSYPDMCIAGNSWGGLGSWNNSGGSMTNNSDGTYTWTSSSVTSGTDCRFKIVVCGTWTGVGYSNKVSGTNCSPHAESNDGSNICFEPAGTGTVTITYNSSTGNIVITCAAGSYSVTYNDNGKTGGSVPTDGTSYTSGSTVTVLGNTGSLVKTGCTFDGWMTAQNGGGTTYAPGATFSITANTTLYARWIAKTIYVYNNVSWGTMNLYTYSDDRNGSWPGSGGVTSLGGNWYQIDILAGAGNLILNNGSGTQTNDLTTSNYTEGRSYYFVDGANNKKDLAEKTLTVTFNMKTHGSAISSQNVYYNGLATTPSPAPTATGYTFGGWYKETGCTNAWNFSTDKVTADTELFAKWTAKTYTVTLDRQGATNGTASVTATYGSNMPSGKTAPSRTGYTFGGYYASTGGSGTQYYNSSMASAHVWDQADNVSIYAKWTEKTYSVTVQTANSTMGKVMSNQTSTTVTAKYVTSDCAITATPESGYRFTGWTKSGNVTIADESAASTTITATSAGATVTANFEALPNGQLDIVAGANGQVKKDGGSWGSSASYTGINTAQNLNIYAQANNGYHFVNWTKTGDGEISTNAATGVYAMTARGSATVTANFAETKHNVTVQYKYGETTIKNSTTESNVGEVTTSEVSAPAISGYTFSSWTVESGITATTSTSSSPISIKTKSSGIYTITANYTEDLSTGGWVICGGSVFGNDTWNQRLALTKKSGHSTEDVGYYTVSISGTNPEGGNAGYNFKVVSPGNTWFGLHTDNCSYDWLYKRDYGTQTMINHSTNNDNVQICADVAGDYEIMVDYSTPASPTVTITFPPSLSWTATSVYSGNASTLTASVGNVTSGKTIKYDVYAGATATGDPVATWSGSTSATTHSHEFSITPSFGDDISKQYTVKITYNGTQTATYTSIIGRKWDIYVHDVQNWGKMSIYTYNDEANGSWPGTVCPKYNGSDSWYTVTLDGKATNFILNKNGEQDSGNNVQTNDLNVNISTYAPNTYWYIDAFRLGNLQSVTVTDPTVEVSTGDDASYMVNTTMIFVTGHITNYGGDGSHATDMKEVGFKIGETKYPMTCKNNDGDYFWGYITGLTAGTAYTVKAYAENIHGTGVSTNSKSITTRAAGTNTIQVRSAVGRAVPKIYAWTDANDCDGIKAQNADWPGIAMTSSITGTTYVWYTYTLSTEYSKFIISENGSNQTDDFVNTFADKCYWYHPTEGAQGDRMGEMLCPYADPTLMIETTAGGGTFDFLTMTGSGTVTKTVALTANSTYAFKPIFNAEYYSKNSTALTRESNSATLNASDENNLTIETDYAGNYTFSFNTSTKVMTVTYPAAYIVNYGYGTGGASVSATGTNSGAFDSGDYVLKNDVVTFSQTAASGYTFKGWYTTADGDVSAGVNGSNQLTINAAKDVYAQYTPNNYTVTFDATTNGGTCATASKGVTFASAYGELPTATHASRQFAGWYTTASEGGTRVTAETLVSTASNHILYARFESTYTVTVQYKCGDIVLRPSTTVNASATSLAAEIEAPEILGYAFSIWSGEEGKVTFGDPTEKSTTVNASDMTTITAEYTEEPMVYFKNNLGWDDVYVTFDCGFNSSKENAPSNNGKPYYKMEQLGTSDIFYYEIPEAYLSNNYANWKWNIAFDNTGFAATGNIGEKDAFDSGEFLGRGDFDPKATMFIPYNGDSEPRNGGTYYRTGCWMKYNSTDPGYKIYANTFVSGSGGSAVGGTPVLLTAEVAGGFEFKAKVYFPTGGWTYGFMLHKEYAKITNDLWYTNYGTIQSNTTTLPWHFTTDGASENGTRCGLKTEAVGDYEFTVSFGTGRPVVNVEYPVSTGDYRLVYKDNATWSNGAHGANWSHPSRIIKKKAGAIDTVSFYVAYGSSPSIKLQTCTSIDGSGKPVWDAGTAVTLGVSAKGIYNYKVTQDAGGNATVAFAGSYTGNFYVRTDASDGGWTNYKTSGANTMTYSEYSLSHGGEGGPFSHYFMRHVNAGSNIKFVVANDYSLCISDTLVNDTYAKEWIEKEANIRFMWYYDTNQIRRAYISGSSNVSDRFLVLEGDEHLYNESGQALTTAGGGKVSGLNDYEMNFIDDQNWIYEATVQANPLERIKLTAKFDKNVQYFYGKEGDRSDTDNTYQLIGGTGDDKYKVRVVYDFKTNRLVCAWLPDGDVTTEFEVDADVMIIRKHQLDAQQITFSGEGSKLTEVKTVYGAMKFNKWILNNKDESTHENTALSQWERDLFFISFPFDVKLSEVFGFGTYGKHWIIEYYDGKGRAEKGYWKDSPTNWKFVTKSMMGTYTLEANQGYVLALDLDELGLNSPVWNYGVENVYLYFPSTATVENIQATSKTVNIDQTGYKCAINRPYGTDGDRRIKDSYWHVLGVPSYANASHGTGSSWTGTAPTAPENPAAWTTSVPYVYTWRADDNTMQIMSSSSMTFKPMYSYMVQYSGTSIEWASVNAYVPTPVAARRNANYKSVYEFRLALQQNGEEKDHTYISLRDNDEVTKDFDFNYDLCKMMYGAFSQATNLYTIIGENVEAAGNCLPLETDKATVVPVGVTIGAAGEYTFTMPEGTEGMSVTLIDNVANTHTNLAMTDYTVTLEAGTHEGRFALEIDPRNATTSVDIIGGEGSETAPRKVFVNGLMYIIRGNDVYDANGRKVE